MIPPNCRMPSARIKKITLMTTSTQTVLMVLICHFLSLNLKVILKDSRLAIVVIIMTDVKYKNLKAVCRYTALHTSPVKSRLPTRITIKLFISLLLYITHIIASHHIKNNMWSFLTSSRRIFEWLSDRLWGIYICLKISILIYNPKVRFDRRGYYYYKLFGLQRAFRSL